MTRVDDAISAAAAPVADRLHGPPDSRRPDAAFVAEARALVKDLFVPIPLIYWVDLLATSAVGHAGFYFAHSSHLAWGWRIGLLCLSGLAFYRAALFIHELVHLNSTELPGFRWVWNALIGIPWLIPTFLYYTHLEHHRPRHYGTHEDGEYLPLGRGPVASILLFLGAGLVAPALAVIRFLVLTPASWMSKSLRSLIHRRASAMVIDPSYARPTPALKEWRIWRIQEVLCLAYLLSIIAGVVSGAIGISWIIQAYALAAFALTVNGIRTLAAHRYRHAPDEPHSLVEQLLDSINHPNRPLLTEIWAPVGLRFHALHHLFPGLPYHALPEAHRRLMAGLPPRSPYRLVNSPGLASSLRQLWRDARGQDFHDLHAGAAPSDGAAGLTHTEALPRGGR